MSYNKFYEYYNRAKEIKVNKICRIVVLSSLLVAFCLTNLQASILCDNEIEPNNEYYNGNPMEVPACMLGAVEAWQAEEGYSVGDSDFFVIETTVGRRYTLNLVIDSPQGLNLRIYITDADNSRVVRSEASPILIKVSFVATTDVSYIHVRYSLSSLPELPAAASYRLDTSTVYYVFLPCTTR